MKKILVVEDYEITQRVMQMMLADLGCQSDIASTGKQALEFFKKNNYYLIFIDIGLPDQDGFTVIEEMRKFDPQKAQVPIIILSAYSDVAYQNKAKSMGIDDYIVKPLMPEDCNTIIKKYLSTGYIKSA